MIPWLRAGQPFPEVSSALRAPNGLLAASPDLAVERLLTAYSHGIFPWYSEGEPVLWWSPDPRMVLFCAEFRASRSLRKILRRSIGDRTVEVWVDRAFGQVMRACAAPRSDDVGTWITHDVMLAYGELHARGLAHSVETWVDGELVGGLYGVSLGRMFYGESMFAREADASKAALANLVAILRAGKFPIIDCQQETSHLASMGARPIPRRAFAERVAALVNSPATARWMPPKVSDVLA